MPVRIHKALPFPRTYPCGLMPAHVDWDGFSIGKFWLIIWDTQMARPEFPDQGSGSPSV